MPDFLTDIGVSFSFFFGTALATAATAEEKHLFMQKDPGPISGSWSVTARR